MAKEEIPRDNQIIPIPYSDGVKVPRDKDIKYPICIKGKRACPPEDCGGIWGYTELLEIIRNPEHEEYEEMMEWLGGKFDPEPFDLVEVGFDDPDKRRKFAFG